MSIPSKPPNGRISTSKIVITIITILFGVTMFLAVTLRSFVSMGVIQYADALENVENIAQENSRVNAAQNTAIENIKEDITEIKNLSRDIYKFVSGVDPY